MSLKIKAGVGEKMQYLVHSFNDNTIRFLLHYPGLIDGAVLSRTLRAVIGQVDILHASFHSSFGSWWQVHSEYAEEDYYCHIKTEGDLWKMAEMLAVEAIPPESKVQIKCWLLQNDTESILVCNMSHLCVDGCDGKYLLQKITEAYELVAQKGDAKELVIKNGSRSPEQVYAKCGKEEIRSLMNNPIPQVKSEFTYPTTEAGSPHLVYVTIPHRVMERAGEHARRDHATLNDVLLAACYQAYGAMPGVDSGAPMSIMSMMDLRKHCASGDSEGLSNMTGSLPTVYTPKAGEYEAGTRDAFADALLQVAAQTKAQKEDPLAGLQGMPLLHGLLRRVPFPLLVACAKYIYGSFPIGLTNLGNLPADFLRMGDLLPDGGLFGGPLKKKPGMQVSVISVEGNCALAVAGEYTEQDADLLRKFLQAMVEQVERYAGTDEL